MTSTGGQIVCQQPAHGGRPLRPCARGASWPATDRPGVGSAPETRSGRPGQILSSQHPLGLEGHPQASLNLRILDAALPVGPLANRSGLLHVGQIGHEPGSEQITQPSDQGSLIGAGGPGPARPVLPTTRSTSQGSVRVHLQPAVRPTSGPDAPTERDLPQSLTSWASTASVST